VSSKPEISRTEALNHHQGWSETTRAQVRDELDRLDAATFRKNVHGFWNSVQVLDSAGTMVADLMKTQVRYFPEYAPPGAEDRGSKDGLLVLSLDGVVRATGERTARQEPVENPVCPRCFLAHAGPDCY